MISLSHNIEHHGNECLASSNVLRFQRTHTRSGDEAHGHTNQGTTSSNSPDIKADDHFTPDKHLLGQQHNRYTANYGLVLRIQPIEKRRQQSICQRSHDDNKTLLAKILAQTNAYFLKHPCFSLHIVSQLYLIALLRVIPGVSAS